MFFGSVNIERSPGGSEDAPPLLKDISSDLGYLFVFDGLGGAGARSVEGPEGVHSSAYYAARYAREECERFIDVHGQSNEFDAQNLGFAIDARLKSEAQASTTPGQAVIKGSLVRSFPTTIAGARVTHVGGLGDVTALWAGDSRVYVLAATGLHQITADHVKGDIDPYENLRKDAPLTNVACADTPVQIFTRAFRVPPPFLVLCATDGCFGYLRTPMHFEDLLLDAFCHGRSPEEVDQLLRTKIDPVTGDDASLCWCASGWHEFAEIATTFVPRAAALKDGFIRPIDDGIARFEEVESLHTTAKKQLESILQGRWSSYRTDYLLEKSDTQS